MRELFEKWVRAQFSAEVDLTFTKGDGYKNETVNAMWIGFNAHAELTKGILKVFERELAGET